MFSSRAAQHTCIGHANHIYDQLYLFSLVGAWEEGKAREKFYHDASKGPHVNLLRVGEDTEHNIRSPIKPALDICVYNFVLKAATSEISNCDPTLVLLLH